MFPNHNHVGAFAMVEKAVLGAACGHLLSTSATRPLNGFKGRLLRAAWGQSPESGLVARSQKQHQGAELWRALLQLPPSKTLNRNEAAPGLHSEPRSLADSSLEAFNRIAHNGFELDDGSLRSCSTLTPNQQTSWMRVFTCALQGGSYLLLQNSTDKAGYET